MPPCPTVFSPIPDQKARQARLSKRYDGLVKKIDGLCILTGAHANLRIFTPEGETKEYATDGWDLEQYISAMESSHKENGWRARHQPTTNSPRKKGKGRQAKRNEQEKARTDSKHAGSQSSPPLRKQATEQAMALPETQISDVKQRAVDDFFSIPIDFDGQTLMQGEGEMWDWNTTMPDDWLAAATTAPDDSSFL